VERGIDGRHSRDCRHSSARAPPPRPAAAPVGRGAGAREVAEEVEPPRRQPHKAPRELDRETRPLPPPAEEGGRVAGLPNVPSRRNDGVKAVGTESGVQQT